MTLAFSAVKFPTNVEFWSLNPRLESLKVRNGRKFGISGGGSPKRVVRDVATSVGKSRAAVLRRSERRRFSSASDDEVGGFHARLREQLKSKGRLAVVVRRGLRRFWLAYQIPQPMPGGTEIGPPAHCILQVHPQTRGDRVRTYHLEADRLQPANRQHA